MTRSTFGMPDRTVVRCASRHASEVNTRSVIGVNTYWQSSRTTTGFAMHNQCLFHEHSNVIRVNTHISCGSSSGCQSVFGIRRHSGHSSRMTRSCSPS